MVHWETDNGVRQVVGVLEVLRSGGREAAVGAELADKRVEVAAAVDIVALQEGVEVVALHTVSVGIDEDREVAMVVLDSGYVLEEGDTVDVLQGIAVCEGCFATVGYCRIHLLEIQETVGAAHLVHLGVYAGADDGGLSGEAEVLQVVYALLGGFVVHYHGPALDGVVDLGGVEAERAQVAPVEDGASFDFYSKGVGGIVDDLQAVAVGDLLYATDVAGIAIDVDGHYGRGLRGDGGLYPFRVEVAGFWVDVDEDGLAAVPPDAVGGGDKGVRRGDDLAGDAQRLEGGEQRQGAVGEEGDERDLEVLRQLLLQLAVELAVIGYPLALPDLVAHGLEVFFLGEQRAGDGYLLGFVEHKLSNMLSYKFSFKLYQPGHVSLAEEFLEAGVFMVSFGPSA